jgi:hypothetical protein
MNKGVNMSSERDDLLTWLQKEVAEIKKSIARGGPRSGPGSDSSDRGYVRAFLDGKVDAMLNTIAFIQTDGKLR